jgi:cobalt-zinc-cadmium efflux system outer membrane protein
LTLARDNLAAVEKRLSAGDIAANEANRFRLDLARADNDLKVAVADLKRAQAEFARAIGAEAQAFELVVAVSAPDSLDDGKPGDVDRRSDVIAAARRVDAAEIARDLAKSIATRDVTLGAQFDRWPTSDANVQGTGNSFGITISVPLFVRHANDGEARRASVDLDVARDQAARLSAQARTEVRVAADGWAASRDRVARVEREVLPLARTIAAAAELAYAKGATGVLDLLDARRNLKQSELDAAQARADAGKAWAQFAAANEIIPGN